jgi:hypothetical protein
MAETARMVALERTLAKAGTVINLRKRQNNLRFALRAWPHLRRPVQSVRMGPWTCLRNKNEKMLQPFGR